MSEMNARIFFKQFLWKPVWLATCLTSLMPAALGQIQNLNGPKIFGIGAYGTNASSQLLSISPDGIKEISDVHGQLLYGSDDNVLAIVEPWGSTNGNRVLVVDRKNSTIIADKYVRGFRPVLMKIGNVERLAVRSKESTVYVPVVERPTFDVAEVNWNSGTIRKPSVPVTDGANLWEITALYSVPPGIVVERGPYFTIFNPTTDTAVLVTNNAGADLRPTGRYYAFPGFGLVQSVRSEEVLYHVMEKDFSTVVALPRSVNFPASITNLIKYSKPLTRTIKGSPCLIWGEIEGDNSLERVSQIVVYDLEAKRELLRKSLSPDFSSSFLPDETGENIYFFNTKTNEIFCLDVESQTMNLFVKLGIYRFVNWIAAN